MNYTDKDPLKLIGQRVKKIREDLGMSQITLSVKAGFNFNYVGLVERGDTNPSILALLNLSLAMDIDVSELVKDLGNDRLRVLRDNPKRKK